jgi:hypothetical protein
VAIFEVYGVRLASDYPFAVPMTVASGPPDLTFTVVDEPPVSWSPNEVEDVCGVGIDEDWGDTLFSFYRLSDVTVVRLHDHADYYLWDDRIVCHLLDPSLAYLVDNQLFGGVLALWLERRGTLALHASAVLVDRSAVAFLAPGHGGKTTTVCAHAEAGSPILTEDLLPLDPDGTVYRGYPMVRMWPELADRFAGGSERYPLSHPLFTKRRVPVGRTGFGSFALSAAPLAACYLLDRGGTDGPVSFSALRPQEALVELLRASFLPVEVQRFGWQPNRVRALAQLLRSVPVRRVHYASDLERLPELVDAIAADVREVRHARSPAGSVSTS